MTIIVPGTIIAGIVVSRCDMCDRAVDLRCLTWLVRAVAVLGPALGLSLGPVLPGAAPLGLRVPPCMAHLQGPAATRAEGVDLW